MIVIKEVPWPDVGDEISDLAVAHHSEATDGREGEFDLNRGLMDALHAQGFVRTVVATNNGCVVGYCIWTVDMSIEVRTLRGMVMGPFYVRPEFAAHGLGRKLMTFSRDMFAREGTQQLRLHHTVHGRGARLGRLYAAMGAVEYQREYLMPIGAR